MIKKFPKIIAYLAIRNPAYVIVDSVQTGEISATTTVKSKIATADAQAAMTLLQSLDSRALDSEYDSLGFNGSSIISLQVSACLPGYELLSPQICQLCPSNYFCSGGSAGSQACLAGTFSSPGANSSSECIPVVFIVVVIHLPIPKANFTEKIKLKFQTALSLTAQVLFD